VGDFKSVVAAAQHGREEAGIHRVVLDDQQASFSLNHARAVFADSQAGARKFPLG